MNRLSLSLTVFFLIVLCNSDVFAQRRNLPHNRVGGAAIYNFQTHSLGLDARAEFPIHRIDLLEGISVVPQLTYYPWFNRVHEFYLGASVHLNMYAIEQWTFYTLLNVSYNGFINYENNEEREGNFSNLGLDPGVGVSRKVLKCMHPFFEFRYNVRWNELNARLGLMYDLNCDRRGAVPCSKIPPQPTF